MQARDIADITYALIRQREDRLIMQYEDQFSYLLREKNNLKSKYDNLKLIAKKQRDNYEKLYNKLQKNKEKYKSRDSYEKKSNPQDNENNNNEFFEKNENEINLYLNNSRNSDQSSDKLKSSPSTKSILGQKRSISFRDNPLYCFEDDKEKKNPKKLNEWLDNEKNVTLVRYFEKIPNGDKGKEIEKKNEPKLEKNSDDSNSLQKNRNSSVKMEKLEKNIEVEEIIDLENSLNNDSFITKTIKRLYSFEDNIEKDESFEEQNKNMIEEFEKRNKDINNDFFNDIDDIEFEKSDEKNKNNHSDSDKEQDIEAPVANQELYEDEDEDEVLSQPIVFKPTPSSISPPSISNKPVIEILSPVRLELPNDSPLKPNPNTNFKKPSSYFTSSSYSSSSKSSDNTIQIYVNRGKKKEKFPSFSCKSCSDFFQTMLQQGIIGKQHEGLICSRSVQELSKVDKILREIENSKGMGNLVGFMKKRPSEKQKDKESEKLKKLYDDLENAILEQAVNEEDNKDKKTKNVIELSERDEQLLLDFFSRCSKHQQQQGTFVTNTPEDFWDLTIKTPDHWV